MNEGAEVEEQDNTGSEQCDTPPGLHVIAERGPEAPWLGRWVDQPVKLSINVISFVLMDW